MKKIVTLFLLPLAIVFVFNVASANETSKQKSNILKTLADKSVTEPVLKYHRNTNDLFMARNLMIPPLAKAPEDNARLFYIQNKSIFPVNEIDFSPLFVETVKLLNGEVVRVKQSINGVPVHGGELIFRMDDNHYIKRIISNLKPVGKNIEAGRFFISREKAIRLAVSEFLDMLPQEVIINNHLIKFTRPEYLVLGGEAIPIYIINVPGKRIIDGRAIFVNAESGKVIGSEPLAIFDSMGKAFESNPGKNADIAAIEVDLPHLNSEEEGSFLKGELMEVYNCLDVGDTISFQGQTFPLCTEQHKAAADADGKYMFEPVLPADYTDPEALEDEFAEVQMYYHTNRIYDHFEQMGFGYLNDVPMYAVVNFKLPAAFMGTGGSGLAPMDNAAFMQKGGMPIGLNATNDIIMFGQGTNVDFSYDADVIYHEFTHAVVSATSNLGFFALDEQGYDDGPFALNEGFADFFSSTLTGDPELGEYVGEALTQPSYGEPSGALRSLANSNTCPKNLWGESHEDGKIWSGALWQIRELYQENIGGDTYVVDAAFFNMLVSLSTSADFYESAITTLDELGEITDEDFVAAAEAVVEERGILPECERVVTLPHQLLFLEGTNMVYLDEVPAMVQFKIEVPEKYKDEKPVAIEFSFIGASGGSMGGWGGSEGDLYLIAKRDAPIKYDMKAPGFPNDSEWEKITLIQSTGLQGQTNYKGYVTNFCFTPGDYYLLIVNTDGSEYQTAYFTSKFLTELPDEAKDSMYNFTGECKTITDDDDATDDDDDDAVDDDDDVADDDDDDTVDDDDTADDDDAVDDDDDAKKEEDDEEEEEKDDEGCACRVR